MKSAPEYTQSAHGILNSHCSDVSTFSNAQNYIRMVIFVPIISMVNTVVALVSLPPENICVSDTL
jgi:hypothetical protein